MGGMRAKVLRLIGTCTHMQLGLQVPGARGEGRRTELSLRLSLGARGSEATSMTRLLTTGGIHVGASRLEVTAGHGRSGRAAGQLLTSWTQHPNVLSPTGAEAFCWDRDVSMAPAHLQICVCAMSPMAGVLSLQLLTPE